MNQRPIGVFDSGLGGLTAVRQLRRIMPSENIIYFGDTSRVPYGNRSRDTILKYARQDTRFLRGFDLKAIVIACGTVSTNCLEDLQAESSIPLIGVVEPAVRRAAEISSARRVGLDAGLFWDDRPMSTLSGGERALIAIALYFAILKVRPTPFCVMDEIEAALDESNVVRYARYMRRMSSKTQFIVITHRRGTMEEADVLYGVTMQEKGVSKMLAINLNDVAAELDIK